ncbi:MAG: hypothetical protein JJT78_17675 [Leptospira sp.]|nr:hypothetical protein [Leptospira sp.]
MLAFLLQSPPGIQGACEKFLQTENLCVGNPANVNLICNGTLQNRIRNRIQPENLRSDDILEKYFRCFDNCNVEFNLASNCGNNRFSTNEAYRRAQRSLSEGGSLGVAALSWTNCYNRCRSVNGQTPPENSGLAESGTTFPEDWFQGE